MIYSIVDVDHLQMRKIIRLCDARLIIERPYLEYTN